MEGEFKREGIARFDKYAESDSPFVEGSLLLVTHLF
jgi:hypothetical protein